MWKCVQSGILNIFSFFFSLFHFNIFTAEKLSELEQTTETSLEFRLGKFFLLDNVEFLPEDLVEFFPSSFCY